jgi:hypothetical protein
MAVIARVVLWELGDELETIFRLAAAEELLPEDRFAAIHDYQAEHRLANGPMEAKLRGSLLVMREIRERTCLIKLARSYGRRWRPIDPDKTARPVYLTQEQLPRPVEVMHKCRRTPTGPVSIAPKAAAGIPARKASKAVRDKDRYKEPARL